MNYLFNFIIFTAATLFACVINDIIKIKTERRLGIAKIPWLMFIRYTPGYFNSIVHMIILFTALMFSYEVMNTSREYILIPLMFIFITKLFLTKRQPNTIYFEAVGMAAIIVCTVPSLLGYHALALLSFISASIAVKVFNKNPEESLPLNAARNITLNSYIILVIFPSTSFAFCIFFAVVLDCIQKIVNVLIPKFNEIRNMRRVFRWSMMLALSVLIINAVVTIMFRG